MAVPSGHHVHNQSLNRDAGINYQVQGGVILNNDDTSSDRITRTFPLITAIASSPRVDTGPSLAASGIYNVSKPLTAGTFAYAAEGKYVIARASDTLSGVSKSNLVFMGCGNFIPEIAQFNGDIGAKLLTAWRQNQFSWTHTLDSGAAITNMRINWLNAAGTAAASPESLSRLDNAGATNSPINAMWAPGGAARNGTGALAYDTDSAANPTRAIPGRLVMKANFVNLNTWTADKTTDRPDFYLYKPITGM